MHKSYVSGVIRADVAEVWAAVRDFSDVSYIAITRECWLEGGQTGSTVGAVRTVRLANGAEPQEILLGLSDLHHHASYQLIDSDVFPFKGYVAELKLTPLSDSGHTLLEWWATYEVPENDRKAAADFIEQEVYQSGIDGLRARLER